jgi:hypothetical protein
MAEERTGEEAQERTQGEAEMIDQEREEQIGAGQVWTAESTNTAPSRVTIQEVAGEYVGFRRWKGGKDPGYIKGRYTGWLGIKELRKRYRLEKRP